ncbi:hypothetical protein A1O3_00336 [Capronia epimyces CBS 606.96]|uniref:NmrA-like domain-containing protein n=1 Tax=Capronia epimyces CBS 606.96 TaxID=1182542 RepID=W9YR91_9EURO|nr:uncharacterized protein A1O3_00336 [Capronia epimyces CBS 606.96]EXJ91786.1 hypothetical protein A1O3_00336 [Capronia epimyces CBS 606.96]
MSSKKLLVVIGATGTQGGSVIETILSDPAWRIRGVTRNPSSSRAQTLAAKGVELAQADINDPSTLTQAFDGAHAIFGLTDSWSLLNPKNESKLKPGQRLIEWAFEEELQYGKNIFDAAAQVPTLERLVYSTLPHLKRLSGGKYDKGYHFDAKGFAVEYAKEKYPELWGKTSLVQLGFYLSNFIGHPWMTPKKNEVTGAYEFRLPAKHYVYPMVAAETDTGLFVQALLAAPAGKNLAAYRQWISGEDFVDLWAKTLGVKATLKFGSVDAALPDFREELDHIFDFGLEYGYFGHSVDKSLIDPHQLDPNLQLGTVEEWIKAQDWSGLEDPSSKWAH